MRRFLVIFLLLIQTFLLCANAGEINYSVKNYDNHIEYISAQTTPQRKISIDFINYENTLISTNSKTQEIFAQRNSNNIDGYFIGFLNCDFENNFDKNTIKTSVFTKYDSIFYLKHLIFTRAP